MTTQYKTVIYLLESFLQQAKENLTTVLIFESHFERAAFEECLNNYHVKQLMERKNIQIVLMDNSSSINFFVVNQDWEITPLTAESGEKQ